MIQSQNFIIKFIAKVIISTSFILALNTAYTLIAIGTYEIVQFVTDDSRNYNDYHYSMIFISLGLIPLYGIVTYLCYFSINQFNKWLWKHD